MFEPNEIRMSRKAEVLDSVGSFTDPRVGDYPKDVYGDAIEFALLVSPDEFREYREEKHDWEVEHGDN